MKVIDLFERQFKTYSKEEVLNSASPKSDPKEYDQAFSRLKRVIKGNKIRIYRGVASVVDIVEFLERSKHLGTSWTYDQSSADVFRDATRGHGDKYVLISDVKDDKVDWIKTFDLNMTPVRGRFESEIRLPTNTSLKVIKVLDDKGAEIDISSIKNKLFKT